MGDRIFREKSVRSYQDPDLRGGLLQLAPPALRGLFAFLATALAAALVLSAVVRVKVTARGRGIVRPASGVFVVRAPASGYVRVTPVTPGQRVAAGEIVVRMDAPVVAPVAGVVDAIPVHADEFVTAGTAVAKIVPDSDRLLGYLAIPSRHRAHLRPGQAVRIGFDEFPASEMGYGRGRVRRVGDDLVTPELARSYLAQDPPPVGPHHLVEVELLALPPGARGSYHNGMPFDGVIAVREQRALTLLLRPLRALVGE